jgi:phosphohistidine phosphatase
MKKLYLVRHAKSSWDSMTLSDFERPLNDRGKKDAPEMAQRLIKQQVIIDAFISSPAKRAKKTAQCFIKEYNRKEDEIIFISSLYHAGIKEFKEAIAAFDDKYKHVAIFSHNPGITEFANELITDANLVNMPTSSVFAVRADVKKWKEFNAAKKTYLFFEYPKKE